MFGCLFTLVSVNRRPLIEVTTMQPTKKNDTCWLQNATSISRPHQWTAISIPRVTGSFFPTRSNMILMVQMNIFHKQYKLKKCPRTLKYLPCNVSAHRWRSCIFRSACTSKNSCRDNSSAAPISNRNCPISAKTEYKAMWMLVILFRLCENNIITFWTGRSLRHTADHAPNARFYITRFVFFTINGNSFLLGQYHVHRKHQPTFQC